MKDGHFDDTMLKAAIDDDGDNEPDMIELYDKDARPGVIFKLLTVLGITVDAGLVDRLEITGLATRESVGIDGESIDVQDVLSRTGEGAQQFDDVIRLLLLQIVFKLVNRWSAGIDEDECDDTITRQELLDIDSGTSGVGQRLFNGEIGQTTFAYIDVLLVGSLEVKQLMVSKRGLAKEEFDPESL
uniref:Uncharacterized protein n=1 Tax=Tetranychus urticae TaxID=32264 RepID=T1KM62_TETUR